jgi:hypothetical protein
MLKQQLHRRKLCMFIGSSKNLTFKHIKISTAITERTHHPITALEHGIRNSSKCGVF